LKLNGSNQDELERQRYELLEMNWVLRLCSQILGRLQGLWIPTYEEGGEREMVANSLSTVHSACRNENTLVETQSGFINPIKTITGTISRSKLDLFHRIVYVALRGNMYFDMEEIPGVFFNSATVFYFVSFFFYLFIHITSQLQNETKSVFVIFLNNNEYSISKIMRICSSLSANVYPYPENKTIYCNNLSDIEVKLNEVGKVIDKSKEQRKLLLNEIKGFILFIFYFFVFVCVDIHV
jgi:hypothetical protein